MTVKSAHLKRRGRVLGLGFNSVTEPNMRQLPGLSTTHRRTYPRFEPAGRVRRAIALCWIRFVSALVLALATASSSGWASPTLITFDDLPETTTGLVVPNGYQNLTWVDFYYLDGVNYVDNPSGYQNGVVSASQVAFMWGAANPGTTASITNSLGFDLISGWLTAAWRDGLQVRVIGYSSGVAVYDNTYTLSTLAPTFINFNYLGVNQVTFSTSGGTQSPVLFGDGYHFLMDNVTVSVNTAFNSTSAGIAFDQLWSAFDRDYAMFVLHPEVDWNASRDHFRPLATNSTSIYGLANVFVQMLQPLQDLHVWLTVSGSYVPIYNPSLPLNANPSAYAGILGSLNNTNPRVQWAVTKDKIGFIAINSWTDPSIPALCQQVMEQMRDTRGLVIDVRSNGGGSEPEALQVAGRFEYANFVYAYDQVRNGTNHTDLTPKAPRTISPRGPWRYDRPVVLLIGQRVASSDESFVGMMTGPTNVTTMGDHTCGASGNPETVQLPFGMTVTVSTWIDYLPDGSLLEGHGFQPQIPFTATANSFTGTNDALLSAALDILRPAPLPVQPVLGLVYGPTVPITFDDLVHKQAVPSAYDGLNWSNFYAYNPLIGVTPAFGIPMLSSPIVAYNGWGAPASITNGVPFDLLSAELAAVFNDNLNLEVQGYRGANLIYDRNFTLSAIVPTAVQFDCCGVTAVSFISSGGTIYRYGGGEQFALDDLVIIPHNAAPIPPLLQNLTQAGGVTTFTWAAQAGQPYQVQYIADLSQTNWTNLGSPLTTGNYTLTGFDSCTNQQRYYRVVALP